MKANRGGYPLPCLLEVGAQNLPDLLLTAFGQLGQDPLWLLLGLDVPAQEK